MAGQALGTGAVGRKRVLFGLLDGAPLDRLQLTVMRRIDGLLAGKPNEAKKALGADIVRFYHGDAGATAVLDDAGRVAAVLGLALALGLGHGSPRMLGAATASRRARR